MEATLKVNNDSKSHSTSTTPTITIKSPPRSKTQISSVYAKLSSVKSTTPASPSSTAAANSKVSSIPTNNSSAKPMKTTKIENSSPMRMQSSANVLRGNEQAKSPLRRTIPTLTKHASPSNGSTTKVSSKMQPKLTPSKTHVDDSNGNSATSSLSTSSSNSSLNASNCLINNANTPSLVNQIKEIYKRGLVKQ